MGADIVANPQVIIGGNTDIYALGYVSKITELKEKKTFRQQRLTTNTYNLLVDNTDDYFSVGKAGSQFNNSDWRYLSIEIYNEDGNLIWAGVIMDIVRNHSNKTAVIQCKNTFFSMRNEVVNYTSSDWETPAEAFKNICMSVGFTKYHQKSYQDSHNVLDANSCKVKVNFNTENSVKFLDAVNKIALIGNADIYVHLDELYYVHWTEFTGGVKVQIDGNKRGILKKAPLVSSPENNLINDYSIDYFGSAGIPVTDTLGDLIGVVSRKKYGVHNQGAVFRTGENSEIIFENITSAKYIGNSLIYKTHRGDLAKQPRPPEKIVVSLFSDNDQWTDLETFFGFSFSDESWDNKTFEMFEFISDDDNDELGCVAYEA